MNAPALQKTPLQLAKEAQQARANDSTLKLTAALIAGDAWAKGEGWTGPRPLPDRNNATAATRTTLEIQRGFVSRNLPENVVTRHVYGIAGREPLLGLTTARPLPEGQKPTEAEQERITAFMQAFRTWWDQSGAWLEVQKALKNAVWSGQGTIRLFIPRSKLSAYGRPGQEVRGVPTGLTLEQAMGYVSVHAPEWNEAGVLRDDDRRVTGAYFRRTDAQGRETWEIQSRADGWTTITPDARDGQEINPQEQDRYPVGQLLTFEIRLTPLITESIRRLAFMGNKTLTMGSRNIDLGGFVERTITNAQMPGRWVDDPDAPGGKRHVPDAIHYGAGVTNVWNGLAVMQPDPNNPGKMIPTGQFSTPGIHYKDPVGWNTFGDTWAAVREAIFEEARQLFVLISGDATASGVSRVQAVQDFLASLEPTRMALEQLLRWLVTTVTQLGLHFTRQRSAWEGLTATAQARVSAVQPTPEQVTQAQALRDKRLISLKTFYSLIGVEEADAETQAITAEGITQDVALLLVDKLPTWAGLYVMREAFPAMRPFLTDERIQAHFDADTGGGPPPTDPADLTDTSLSGNDTQP